ncbi:NAD-dependent epimerase/dehydratase family protein [Streptomyces sp. BHT-5-2]|uniref:NAD-dependent epimerase/dehydratase family protein n=1 Tax=Streptomyces sp. BHT-5-2 TaxID=2866715 RepID=UPI0028C3FBD6|nr:NAD-dependent epimerase/dehydratase family protein [Streptomyces sp. BHT-5-2]
MADHQRMRILILGGSVFLGRAFVTEAQRRGHEVTVFNRGRSGTDPEGVEVVRGDREVADDLRRLAEDHTWDAVVDTSGMHPRVVGESARALSGHAGAYLFVSSFHAYEGWPAEIVSETSPRHACASDAAPDDVTYNALKAGCERAVEESFAGDALILNPGVIVGPHESTGRLLWWLERMARGGQVLAPGRADQSVQVIDARDIAAFGLDQLEVQATGRFLVTGPVGATSFGDLLAGCAEVTGSDAEVVWVDETFLLDKEVAVWTGLPLWAVDQPGMAGTWLASSDKALAAGLRCRPLAETLRDTWQWLQDRGPAAGPYKQGTTLLGLEPEQEQRLLAEWGARRGSESA